MKSKQNKLLGFSRKVHDVVLDF